MAPVSVYRAMFTLSGDNVQYQPLLSTFNEACIGVLGIQDICYFTSRDIGYFPFYFQGYEILCSISGILLFFLQNIQIQLVEISISQ